MAYRGISRQKLQPQPVGHSNSRKWVAPARQKEDAFNKKRTFRAHYCPNSFAWTADFDFDKHQKDCEEASKQYAIDLSARLQTEKDAMIAARKKWGIDEEPVYTKIKPAFGGKKFGTNHSMVLAQQTVFTPEYEYYRHSELAPWPGKEEMRYEGDERIATDVLHRRFLAAPRVKGNDTVNWMQKPIIEQYPFDDFYYGYATDWIEDGDLFRGNPRHLRLPNKASVFFGGQYIPGLQVSDEQGKERLGEGVWKGLDV